MYTIEHKIKRVEYKYFIPSKYVDDLKYCLSKVMLEDSNNKSSRGYKITSLYFDTLEDKDLNQELDRIIYREKYRLRVYDKDTSFGKFEVERKLNQVVEKLSMELTNVDVSNIITGDYMDYSMINNLLIISKDVVYKNLENILSADVIELDTINKNTKIFMHNSKDKVKVKNLN